METKPTPKMVEKAVPRKIRGTLTILEEDDMEFRAQRSTGISTQAVVKSDGKSKIYETVGEKKQNMVAHLVVSKDDPDPAGTMFAQLAKLTKDMQPKKLPPMRGKVLLDDESARVAFNNEGKKIDIRMTIDLQATPNYNQSLMNLMYKINQCFAINQTLLVNARK